MATLIECIDHILVDGCTQGKGRYGGLEVRVPLARDRARVLAEVSQDDLLELFPELDLDEGIELDDIDWMPP